MPDMLATGLAWLTGQLKANASQTVTYTRGNLGVDVQATFGKKLLKLDDGFGGIRMEWTDIDFLIPAADLSFDGLSILPSRGDLIFVTVGYQVQTYQVFPYGTDPAWRWSDPGQTMMRIHAKYVSGEPSDPKDY